MYALEITEAFSKQADLLHPKRYKQVHMRILALQRNPRPPNAVMMEPDIYRIHVGPYTVSYRVDDDRGRIIVFLLEENEPNEALDTLLE